MHVSRWVSLPLLACMWSVSADAQIIHLLSETREVYGKGEIRCADPVELRKTPSNPFATFDDNVIASINRYAPCWSEAYAHASQRSLILGDSIYVHEYVITSLSGDSAEVALARSDASITFRVEAGQRCRVLLDGGLRGKQYGGVVVVSFSLSKLGTGGGVIDTLRVQAGPGPPSDKAESFWRRHLLEAGDYTLEAHSSCEGPTPWGELFLEVTFDDLTPVEPSTWGQVKALYRD